MSKRQDIVDAMLTALSTLKYPHANIGVGCRVFDWRRLPPAKKDVPALVLWDLESEISTAGVAAGFQRHILNVEVGVFVDSKFSPKDMRLFCEDVVSSFSSSPFLGTLLEEPIAVVKIGMSAAEVGEVVVAAVVGFVCTYKTEVWNV